MSGIHHILRWGLVVLVLASAAAGQTVADLKAAAAAMDDAKAMPEDTEELLIFLKPGEDVQKFAADRGMVVKHTLRSDPDAHVLTTPSVTAARQMSETLAAHPAVRQVYVNQKTRYVKMAFVPNDPYFHKNTPSGSWPGQWHLINEHVAGRDARVQGAWNRDITGSGVLIGICDDSFEVAHPDLAPNYVAADSWDFGQNDNNPSPVWSDDQHGVSVGGVAAARGGNGIGVTGAAPYAGLAGLRIDFENQTTQMFVDATLYHSSGSNTNIKVKNHSYGIDYPYWLTTAEADALNTSTAAGTIHCFAAGNARSDTNKQDLQKSPNAISVAAFGSNGKFAGYSNFGACVTVCAPSSSTGYFGVTTTDRTGSLGYNGSDTFPDEDYTTQFGGTSSASPLVAGVMALVKEVQPALNTRFAKHLLAMTSDVVDPSDSTSTSGGGWVTNAAGFHFNQNYGFGLIDADQLTATASQYGGVTELLTEQTSLITVNASIPDGSQTGVTQTFTLSATTPLEEVLVYIKATHTYPGELEAWLTSPSNTKGRVMMAGYGPNDNLEWTFTCNQFWGENPAGTWTLKVLDAYTSDTGMWNSFRVTARMGSLIGGATPPAILTHPADAFVAPGSTAGFSTVATGAQPLSYQWQFDGVDLVNGGRISGATSPTLQIADCSFDDAGPYRCVVSNAYGSAESNPATLGITHIVESREGGQNFASYSEWGTYSSSSVKSTAVGTTPGIGSRWASMDTAASGICRAIYEFSPVRTGQYDIYVTWPPSDNAGSQIEHVVTHDEGTSSVMMDQDRVTNPGGGNNWNYLGRYKLRTGSVFDVTQTNEHYPDPGQIMRCDAVRWVLVVPGPGGPEISRQPERQDVCAGETAVFSVLAAGIGTITYQWQKDGVDIEDGGRIAGATTDTLTVSDVQDTDAGLYRCVLTDDKGVTNSTAAPLVFGPPVITVQPVAQTVEEGYDTTFSVEITGAAPFTYQWQRNNENLSDDGHFVGVNTATLNIISARMADSGDFRCLVAGRCGSLDTDVAVLTVTPPVRGCVKNGSFEEDFSQGIGSSWTQFAVTGTVTCEASTDALNGTWAQRIRSGNSSNTGGIYQRFRAEPGQEYTIRVWIKTSNSSVMEGCLGVDPAGGTDWNSVPSEYRDITNQTTWSQQVVTATAAGNYMTVFLHARSTKSTSPGYVYFDDVEPDCSFAAPAITRQPVTRYSCPDETIRFSIACAGTWPLVYQWQRNGVDLADGGHYSGTTTNELVVSPVDAGDEASYRCVVNNAFGTAMSGSAALWTKTRTAITQQPTSQTVCGRSSAQFSVTAEGYGEMIYQWRKGSVDLVDDDRISGAQTASLAIIKTHAEDAGEYRCVVSAECGSITSEMAMLEMKPQVAPDLSGDCDVDADDFSMFADCLSGSGVPAATECESRDFDADGDVDQADFGIMQRCFSGTDVPPLADCAD